MTVKEAAQKLEISPSLVYALIAAGKLEANRHGLGRGTLRISQEQLDDYLATSVFQAKIPLPTTHRGQFRFLNAEKLKTAWREK